MILEASSYAELCALEPEWSDLWTRACHASVFQSPEWLLAWWRHLFRGGTMWTVVVREQGRLRGLAPMFIYGRPSEPRRVAFIGSGVSDYLGLLVENADVAQQIWSRIAGSHDRWDICDLQEIPPECRTPPTELAFRQSVSSVCPVLALPSTMAQLEQQLSPKFRHNLRNSRNRLAELGATFETATVAEDGEYIDALYRLHAARWQTKNEPGVLATPEVQCFLRDALAGFRRRGWLRFHGLRFRCELSAVVCIFCAHLRSAYYVGGFDPALSRFSPGNALVAFAIDCAIRERCVEFDLLRNEEQYKYKWGAAGRANTRLVLAR